MEKKNNVKIELGLKSPINGDEEDFESNNLNRNDGNPKSKKCLIIGISIAALIIIITTIILIVVLSNKGNDEEKTDEEKTDEKEIDKEKIGEIICQFNIKNENQETKILGDEFINNSQLDIYIDGEKINFSKTYNIKSIGNHKIEFIFYDNLNIDYMFKDVEDLYKIEIISENSSKIYSMISTFENCINLESFNFSGIDFSDLRSMKKLLYNTNIKENTYFFLNSRFNKA